jgi:hypothetical protein
MLAIKFITTFLANFTSPYIDLVFSNVAIDFLQYTSKFHTNLETKWHHNFNSYFFGFLGMYYGAKK